MAMRCCCQSFLTLATVVVAAAAAAVVVVVIIVIVVVMVAFIFLDNCYSLQPFKTMLVFVFIACTWMHD